MAARRDAGTGIDRQLVRDRGPAAARSANLPAADINGAVAVVVEFDELIAGASRPTRAELADYHGQCRCRRRGRRGTRRWRGTGARTWRWRRIRTRRR